MANKSVEKKVTASTAGSYIASTGLIASLTAVHDDSRLVEWMPDGLTPFVLALIPAAITFLSGWQARHTYRNPPAPPVQGL
ncbi:holin [Streptomyces sp. 796.1]|uniref:holin n=1 Tax=Streptomyces sp. 796.1 TaxID=3163029 RepID=UPI0039C97764